MWPANRRGTSPRSAALPLRCSVAAHATTQGAARTPRAGRSAVGCTERSERWPLLSQRALAPSALPGGGRKLAQCTLWCFHFLGAPRELQRSAAASQQKRWRGSRDMFDVAARTCRIAFRECVTGIAVCTPGPAHFAQTGRRRLCMRRAGNVVASCVCSHVKLLFADGRTVSRSVHRAWVASGAGCRLWFRCGLSVELVFGL